MRFRWENEVRRRAVSAEGVIKQACKTINDYLESNLSDAQKRPLIQEELTKIRNEAGMFRMYGDWLLKEIDAAKAPYTPEVTEAIELLLETFGVNDDDDD
jgi:hypothetical protein